MKLARLVVMLAIALSACGKKTESGATGSGSASPAPTGGSAAMMPIPSTNVSAQAEREAFVKKMETLTDEMCACTSAECTTGVNERLTAWSVEAANQVSLTKEKPSPDHEQRMSVTSKRYADCMTAVVTATPPSE